MRRMCMQCVPDLPSPSPQLEGLGMRLIQAGKSSHFSVYFLSYLRLQAIAKHTLKEVSRVHGNVLVSFVVAIPAHPDRQAILD